ncbi:roadblock/LC7 domain-containing protein [candidate division TA06 bacterium]|uniref:Roadblock/LC7 domain-containing protein n=1 Tax=candidate division TA06 bacterium TaxID=2250710 RepID=A0A933MKA4_UNCT6|nr:roadblock/LC7 domain-containing protein [candidate division TA06 bacterium]
MTNLQFVISEEVTIAVEREMAVYIKSSRAKCAILLSKNGHLISQSGYITDFNLQPISALIGGIFSSTQALAHLVHEEKFKVMFQEGSKWNVYFCLVAEHFILATIFDKSTVVGMIRHAAAEAEKTLAPHLEKTLSDEGDNAPLADEEIAEPASAGRQEKQEIILPDLNKEVEDALSKLFS